MADGTVAGGVVEQNIKVGGDQSQQASQGTADAGGKAALLSDGDAGGSQPNGAEQGASGGQGHNSGGGFDANGDWRAGFAEGLDEATGKTWGNISARYTSPADMAKAHVNLVQSMDKRIAIPDENAKPEDWDQVYNKLGRPETADKYTFDFPQDAPWDDDHKAQLKGLAPLFHKNGATQRQVNEFIKQQAELDKVAMDAARARANTLQQQRMATLKTEWRTDFDRNKKFIGDTVRHYAGNDTDEIAGLRLEDGTFAIDHPAMARVFAKVGAERAEDDRDPTGFNAGVRENVKAQIKQIEEEALSCGLTPTSPQWPNAKLAPLYANAHGSKNLFGAA